MTDGAHEADDRSGRWALPASAIAHALVAALLIFGLPFSLPQPQEEQAVSVTIEPAPEEAEAAAPAPPPAPPAEPSEQAESEEPPPPAAQEQAADTPVPVLQPVVKYGETDAGPRAALDGAGADDSPDTPTQSVAEKSVDEAEQQSPAEADTPAAETEKQAEDAESDASGQPDPTADDSSGAPQLVASTAGTEAPPPPPEPKPTVAEAAPKSELQEARRLFSQSATGGSTATTAMAGLPRGVRAGRLCASELRLQLLYGATPYSPELLPSYELKGGTVMRFEHSAFRAQGRWYTLGFECEVDADATKVVSFAFRVGAPLSREEAQRRGLPSR
jgi:hypothetical protein